MMLIFESTKTNTPIPQQDPAPIFISPPHTQPWHNDDRGNKRRWHTSIFKQKPTQISCVKQCKINATSASDSSPSRSLISLHRWKAAPIFMRVFLIFCFSDFFPAICSRSANIRLCSQIEHSLLSIITRHAPYCWLATNVFWDSFRKAFFKNCLVHH